VIVVDDLVDRGWRYGANCHLLADDLAPDGLAALHALAARIGLRRAYFQPASYPHYDLTAGQRAAALAAGATAVSCREVVRIMREARRKARGA
jgi:hypothetical protein